MESLQNNMDALGKGILICEKKLGLENAKRVLKAFSKDEQHFGFIKVSENELAELTSLYNLSKMAMGGRNVYCFRAGAWLVMIVVHTSYIEVHLINPYDINDNIITITDI